MKKCVLSRLQPAVYDFFMDNYEDEDIANEKSVTIPEQIADLMECIDNDFISELYDNTTKKIHTLKHLLLYADLDDESDLCQNLENDMGNGIFNHSLKEEIFEKIVK